jgi:hypothetical protein
LTTRIALALVILVAALLTASTWRVFGHTWDEPEHLAAGIELLDRGRYEYDTEHPPVGRILMALGPYLAGARSYGTPPPDGVQEGIDILYRSGHYDLFLTLARLGMLPFLVLLLWSMWLWGRRVGAGDGEALLGVVLLASVPPILGHAALATLDVAAAGTTLLALYTAQQWIASGKWQHAVYFGLAAGLAFATKFSAIPFIVLGTVVLAVARVALAGLGRRKAAGSAVRGEGPAAAQLLSVKATAVGVVAALVAVTVPITAAYGIHSADPSLVTRRFDWGVGYLLRDHASLANGIRAFASHVWLPRGLKLFTEGVAAVKAHNDTGHVSFLLGQLKANGWWYFYLVALAVKTPLTLLATSPFGLFLMTRDGWVERNPWRLAPLLLFVTLLVFASTFSHINIGIRHMLILYPFVALAGAYALAKAWHALDKIRQRTPQLFLLGRAVIVVLVGWQVSTLYTAHPDYLPYFNETVSDPQRVLVDSDLDWGQDLRRLEIRLQELKVPHVNLGYLGTADLQREPLPPFTRLGPNQPVTGWIAISALEREHWPTGFLWLDAYKPLERVGKTIDLYYIPPGASRTATWRGARAACDPPKKVARSA